MGIIRKNKPVGTEAVIDRLQVKLFSVLCSKWGLTADKYNCYPKIFRNQSATNEYVAEWFDGKDYVEAYFNDAVVVTSFFGIGDSSFSGDSNGIETTNIHLVYFVDLSKIVKDPPLPQNERNDETIRLDVQTVINTYGLAYGCLLTKAGVGIDYCLKEYPGSRKEAGLKFRDQHPLHCFRFDFQIFYDPTLKDCGHTI